MVAHSYKAQIDPARPGDLEVGPKRRSRKFALDQSPQVGLRPLMCSWPPGRKAAKPLVACRSKAPPDSCRYIPFPPGMSGGNIAGTTLGEGSLNTSL